MKKVHAVILLLAVCTFAVVADWRDRHEVAPAYVFYFSEASGWTNQPTADATGANYCYELTKSETYIVSINGTEQKIQGPLSPCFNVAIATRVRVFDPPTKK